MVKVLFEELWEKNVMEGRFVMDDGVGICGVRKKKGDEGEKVERFEVFMNSWEMCKG